MSSTAFSNLAQGIIVFSETISAGKDSIISAAQTLGESLAALVTSFIGRIILDIGNGVSSLAQTVQGKEGEIFNAAASLGKALIAGLVGGLVGIGQAVFGAIFDGLNSVFNSVGLDSTYAISL